FYTTPVKALSNQKYRDLKSLVGPDNVGLLTGDRSENPDAKVVVMTTEVLRNMLYATGTPKELHAVVLDEVHYLKDPYRGGVWEEVITHLSSNVLLIALSATVSNAMELGMWLETVHGPTKVIEHSKRPVPLRFEMFFNSSDESAMRMELISSKGRAKGYEQFVNLINLSHQRASHFPYSHSMGSDPRLKRPHKSAVVEDLRESNLLPVLYFVFSRKGCDQSVKDAISEGLCLTSPKERKEIQEIAFEGVHLLTDSDLESLDFGTWLHSLEMGFASHHAGVVTPFRAIIEVCFQKSLVKAIFATETMALGIHMPARSVVLDGLVKRSDAGMRELEPGEFTQMAGRAGRRGIDQVGHVGLTFDARLETKRVMKLIQSRDFYIESTFHPSYNGIANLIQRHDFKEIRHIFSSSFAARYGKEELLSELYGRKEMLEKWGFLTNYDNRITEKGRMLSKCFNECDLLIVEALEEGIFSGLSPGELAALVSCFAFEMRPGNLRAGFKPVRTPSQTKPLNRFQKKSKYPKEAPLLRDLPGKSSSISEKFIDKWEDLMDLSRDISIDERSFHLPLIRQVNNLFANAAYFWTSGATFAEALEVSPVTGGDFARTMRGILDLLMQLTQIASETSLVAAGRKAIDIIDRGIVAASSTSWNVVEESQDFSDIESIRD
ncbi:MAG: DEAD/DEAH box helicase, partial [Acidimicrobiales bacterium]|nr:DEAD/DEAH box helicase [Acidimicrobiales bacterium]